LRMTTKTPEALETQIERLVREQLAAQQLAVKAAVDRAFATTSSVLHPPVRRRAMSTRRPPGEMAQLAEQLLEAVQACPGETMTVIAARVGELPRALNRPMMHLKRAGRVRSAGERSLTRYFPMVVKA
jgi:hypothetical protein